MTTTAEGTGSTNTWKGLYLYVNGGVKQLFRTYTNSHGTVGGTIVLELNANDVLTLKHYGANINFHTNHYQIYFGGELIV